MSERELRRVAMLGRVAAGELKLVQAAELLELSYRQGKRIWRRYREEGAEGLVHRSAGRPSNRSYPERWRRQVLRLVREKYSGDVGKRFGPTLAAEHLAEENRIEVHAETLRRWMLAEGLWSRERKRAPYRKRRQRREHFGELVQMDGSFEAWLEERGPEGCLMNLVDDATATTQCWLEEQETIWAAAGALRRWVERYGVPRALYTDWKNVYVRQPTAQELVTGEVPQTQFGRMCARLGIRIVAASSPQAKGRVERSHGTHQDRLIKKLRRRNVCTHAGANRYLEQEYLAEHNRRFARPPVGKEDFHRPAPTAAQLDRIFRLQSERVISNDWVIRYNGRSLQLQRQSQRYAPAQAKVTVWEAEEGSLEVDYRGQKLEWKEIASAAGGASSATQTRGQAPARRPRTGRRWKPAAEHPWRRGYEKRMHLRASNREAAASRDALSASAPP